MPRGRPRSGSSPHVRNQADVLPSFLRHYEALGVDRFFIVDNGSTDETMPFLLSRPNVHAYHTTEKMVESNSGSDWTNDLLYRYGLGRWCLVQDVDEFLVYPHWEAMTLPGLTRYLDERHVTALYCLLLDMYAEVPLESVRFPRIVDPRCLPILRSKRPHAAGRGAT